MSDTRKYYYIRLKEDFFDSPNIVVLESLKNGVIYSNILLKLYLKSLKMNGRLMVNDVIPYDVKMIAQITRQKVKVVEEAMEVFKQYGLVEILENGAIYMTDIQNLIGKSSSEADRQREYDRRIAEEKKSIRNLKEISEKSTPEIELEKDIELEKELKDRINYQQIADMYNNTCVSFPRLTKLSDARKKAIKARLNIYTVEDFQKLFTMAEESNFLKGKNDRNWSANFDWLIKDSNMAKVLDGNYTEKPLEESEQKPEYDMHYLDKTMREIVERGEPFGEDAPFK